MIYTFEGFADAYLKHTKNEKSIVESIIDQIDNNEFLSSTHKDMLRNKLSKDLDDFDFTDDELQTIKDIESGVGDIEEASDEFLNKFMQFQDRVQKSIESLNIKFRDSYSKDELLDPNEDW